MVQESPTLEQDYIFLMQTRNSVLEDLLSESVVGENVRFVSIDKSEEIDRQKLNGQIITFIICSDVEDPVQSAQRLHAVNENARIVLLAGSEENAEVLKEALRYSPFIGSNVSCLDETNESNIEELKNILRNSLKAEKYRALIAETNTRITSSVTSHKKIHNQQFINKLMDIAPIGIAILNKNCRVLGWNKEAAAIFGKNEAKVLGTSFYKLFEQPERDKLSDYLKDSFANNKGPGPAETLNFERSTQDGFTQSLNFTSALFNYSDGPEKVLVLTIKDITEQVEERNKRRDIQENYTKQLEEEIKERTIALRNANAELLQKNDDLAKMNKELEAFAYVSSHDLQEPLRKIQTFAGRLVEKENENLSDKGRMYLDLMQNSTSRMQTLIDDLLSFSRLQTAERKFEHVDLREIVEDVKSTFRLTMEEKNAEISISELCSADVIVFQFRQLMHNLISNALKFSKPGVPPVIVIKGRLLKGEDLKPADLLPDRTYCHLSVTDNGIGIREEFNEKIFQVFQRLHSKDDFPGTGIGLATVKKIVDIHQGIITVTSRPGEGSTFDIYLPFHNE